jgi:hypothetical protein
VLADTLEVVANAQPPRQLTPAQLGALFATAQSAAVYIKELDEHVANVLAETPDAIPGVELKEGRSTRYIADPAGLVGTLSLFVPESALYRPKELDTLTNLEKLVGKKQFADIAGPYIGKSSGKMKPTIKKQPKKQ